MAQGSTRQRVTLVDDSGKALQTKPFDGGTVLEQATDEAILAALNENNALLKQLVNLTREGLRPRGPNRDVDL